MLAEQAGRQPASLLTSAAATSSSCAASPLSPPAGRGAIPAAVGRAAQIASLTWLTSSTRDANRWCSATSRSAFSSSGPGFRCTFAVLPPIRRVRLYCGPCPRCPAARRRSSACRTCATPRSARPAGRPRPGRSGRTSRRRWRSSHARVTPGEVSHVRPPSLSDNVTQTGSMTCLDRAPHDLVVHPDGTSPEQAGPADWISGP